MKRFSLVFCLVVSVTALAQMPKTLNYQGTLAKGSAPVVDGDYTVTFRLYTASAGGSAVWSESQSVTARNGVFNAILGKTVALPASFSTSYWMSLQVGADPELSPRLEMTGVSYSMHALVADSAKKVANASITTTQILDGTITSADIAAGGIVASNIFDEPGLASIYRFTTVYLNAGNIVYAIDSVDITLPAAGYVFVIASGHGVLYHTNGTNTGIWAMLGRSAAAGGTGTPGCVNLAVSSAVATATYAIPFTTSLMFQEFSSGTKRYYLNAYYVSGTSTNTSIGHRTLSAIYFPTAR